MMSDDQRITLGLRALIRACGSDPGNDDLIDTPQRVLRAFKELTSGHKIDPNVILSKTFSNPVNDQIIVVRDIPFTSVCEHHLMPFMGRVTVGYLPDISGQVIGLSKIPRLVECFSKRLQLQERMTHEIATALDRGLSPRGVGVVVKASHLCMKIRGVKTEGEMVTSALFGSFRDGNRSEFLSLAGVL